MTIDVVKEEQLSFPYLTPKPRGTHVSYNLQWPPVENQSRKTIGSACNVFLLCHTGIMT